jgi:hypothetical protein
MFILVAQLDEFEIKDFMLDLGSDVNILPKKDLGSLRKTLVYILLNPSKNGQSIL